MLFITACIYYHIQKPTKLNPMYLAYSAMSAINNQPQSMEAEEHINHEIALRYKAYQATCNKFSREIAAIQQYMPGWMPKFSSLT